MSQTTARKGNYAEPPTNTTRPSGPSASDEFERFFAEQFRVLTPQPPVTSAPPAASVKVEPNFDDPLMAELARIVGHGSPVLPKRQSPASPVETPALPYGDTHFGEPRLVDASMGYWNDQSPPAPSPAPVAALAKPVDPLDAFEAELRRFDEMHRSNLRPEQAKTVLDLSQHQVAAAPVDPLQSVEDELRRYGSEAPVPHPAAGEPSYTDPVNPENIIPFDHKRSRKVVLMLGTAATVALVGVIGAVSMKTAKRPGNGDAPVISASTLPIKEKPADPGGVEIPGQDRQVLAKGAVEAPKAANVVNREEQPVDLNQTPKRDVARVILPAPVGGAATGQAAQRPAAPIIMPPNNATAQPAAPATAGGFEAKRVRSVKVGPEGNAVAPPVAVVPAAPVAAPLAAPVVEATPPVVAAPVAPKVATPATAPKVETKTASVPKSDARPTTAARTQTTTPQPQRQAARTAPAPAAADDDEDDVAGNKPLSLRPPAGASATRPVARTTSAPATTASTGGGFAVQLAAAGSEAEARSTAASMKQRHSALSSYSPSWRSSEVNGRTVYRVRVGGLSREKANELCGQIKSGGGSCFVASN